MKRLRACLSAREYRKSSLHRCGGLVMLVKPVYVRERPDNAALITEGVL